MGKLVRRGAVAVGVLLGVCTMVVAVARVAALDWPVKQRILTATFGENRGDHFHNGIDIGGGGQAVHPAAPGEVIFTFDEGSDTRTLPTGLGSFMVIQNGPEFRTLYAHMRRGTVLRDKPQVTSGDVIGIVGDTGDSLGEHLHFEVIDQKNHEILNPLTLLPTLPEKAPPVIASVSLLRDKKLTRLEPGMRVQRGEADLVVDTYEPSQFVGYFDPMAPYEITATLNGRALFHVVYDALAAKNGRVYLTGSGSRGFSEYYVSTWGVRLGAVSLKPGIARLAVTVKDVAGNETRRLFVLAVQGNGGG